MLVNLPLRCAIVGRAIERHRCAARVDLDFGGSVAPVRALASPHPATVYSSVWQSPHDGECRFAAKHVDSYVTIARVTLDPFGNGGYYWKRTHSQID